MCNLLLPLQLVLAIDLRNGIKLLALLQQNRSEDDLVWHDGLLVVRVRGAVGAVEAVDWIACSFLST